jgi:hypothetical protein
VHERIKQRRAEMTRWTPARRGNENTHQPRPRGWARIGGCLVRPVRRSRFQKRRITLSHFKTFRSLPKPPIISRILNLIRDKIHPIPGKWS